MNASYQNMLPSLGISITTPIVNIGKLWSLILKDVKASVTTDSAPLIDVTRFVYFKFLGKGDLPSQPIIVKAIHAGREEYQGSWRGTHVDNLIGFFTTLDF